MNNFDQSEEDLFQKCLELPAGERTRFLDETCLDDPVLRAGVLSLLHAHATAGGILDSLQLHDTSGVAARLRGLAPTEENPGDHIGRYQLREKIGEGAWGSVWRARQTADIKREVALKILKLGLDTKDFLARFEAERQMLAMMDHPNIARVFDAGATERGRPYLVMELVRGIPILEYADRHKLSLADRVTLFVKVCEALDHAHGKGVIHRDLKPSNILVTLQDDEPVPKVIDFGVAKPKNFRATDKTLLTNIHTFIGTPVYSSPEQLEFSGQEVDARSDVYSLGVLLYELLCGCQPFDCEEMTDPGIEAFRQLVRECDPARPSARFRGLRAATRESLAASRACTPAKIESRLRGDLDWIIVKCLEKEPHRRYRSAKDLADDLRAYLDGRPVSAAAPSVTYRARKFIQRNRPAHAIWLELSVLLMVAVGVGLFLTRREPAPGGTPLVLTQNSIAVLPLQNGSETPDDAFFADSLHEDIINNLSQIADFLVIGRISTLRYKDSALPPPQIGQELGVRYLVTGSLRHTVGRFQVNMQLLDARTGAQLWSEQYDRPNHERYTIQGTITRRIAARLNASLSTEELARIQYLPTDNPEAYDLFLRARRLIVTSSSGGAEKIRLLEQAVGLDPAFAEAWAQLAIERVYWWKVNRHGKDEDLLRAAHDALDQARTHGPGLAVIPFAESSFALHVEQDMEKAQDKILRTLEIDPGLSRARQILGNRYFNLGRFSDAQHHFLSLLRTDPFYRSANAWLVRTYQARGMWDDAARLIEENARRFPDDPYWPVRRALNAYLKDGDRIRFVDTLARLEPFAEEQVGREWIALMKRDLPAALANLTAPPGAETRNPTELVFSTFPSNRNSLNFEPHNLLSALIRYKLGHLEQAREQARIARTYWQAFIDDNPRVEPDFLSSVAICHAIEGDIPAMDAAIARVQQLTAKPFWSFTRQAQCELHIAIANLIAGRPGVALALIEAASRLKSPIFLRREIDAWFMFDDLRNHPRFAAVLRGETPPPAAFVTPVAPGTPSPFPAVPEKSIAVLPFKDLSPDPENAIFANSMHELVLDRLADIHSLQVIGQRSVRRYRDTVKPYSLITRELDVDYLARGSVRREADQLHISVNLTGPGGDRPLWQQSYTRRFEDVFAMVSTIARDIAGELQLTLSPEETAALERAPTNNPEAYEYLLRGQNAPWQDRLPLLEKAVELDPDYYSAWSALAWSRMAHWRFRTRGTDAALLESAREALRQMIRLEPVPGASLGTQASFAYQTENDLEKALLFNLKARELGLSGRDIGVRCLQLGRLAEAGFYLENALKSDPLAQSNINRLYWFYMRTGRYADARRLWEDFVARIGRDLDEGRVHDTLDAHEFLTTGNLERFIEARRPVLTELNTIDARLWLALVTRDHRTAAELIQHEDRSDLWFYLSGQPGPNYNRGLFVAPQALLAALNWHALGDREAALREAEAARTRLAGNLEASEIERKHPDGFGLLAICHALKGNRAEVEALIPKIRALATTTNNQYRYQGLCEMQIAIAYTILGDHDEAIDTLIAASKLKTLLFIAREAQLWFMFDPLRGDPRFDALIAPKPANDVEVFTQHRQENSGNAEAYDLWQRSFEARTTDERFDLAAQATRMGLDAEAAWPELTRRGVVPTDNVEAYKLLLQSFEAPTVGKRIDLLEEATRLDPDFEAGWSEFARAMFAWPGDIDPINKEIGQKIWNALDELERLRPEVDVMVMRSSFLWHARRDLKGSIEMLHEAQSLDPMAPQVNRHLGIRYEALGEFAQAEKYFELADQVTPLANGIPLCLAIVHAGQRKWAALDEVMSRVFQDERFSRGTPYHWSDRGTWLRWKAFFEFLRTGDRIAYADALEAVPHDPNGLTYIDQHLVRREFEQSLRLLKGDPEIRTFFDSRYRLFRLSVRTRELLMAMIAYRLDWEGDQREYAHQALGTLSKAFNENPYAEPDEGALLSLCYALVGDRGQALETIDRARERSRTMAVHYWAAAHSEALIAMTHVVLGDHEAAIESLETAMSMPNDFLNRYVDLWFMFDPLRGDPRFETLIGEMTGSDAPSLRGNSLAILPLAGSGGRERDQQLADGLHTILQEKFSQYRSIRSIAQKSLAAVGNGPIDAGRIGRDLGVATILTGEVKFEDGIIQVRVRAINTDTGRSIWTERFTHAYSAESLYRIAVDIAFGLGDALHLESEAVTRQRLDRVPTVRTAALEAYLRARAILDSQVQSRRDESIELFKTAIELDPRFAEAYIHLGEAYLSEPVVAKRTDGFGREAVARAETAVSAALKLDDTLANAHFVMGRIQSRKFQMGMTETWEAARQSLNKALELNPNHAAAYAEYGKLLFGWGDRLDQNDADSQDLILSWFQKAVTLDPQNHELRRSLAQALETFGRYEEAVRELQFAIRIKPDFAAAYRNLGILHFKAFGRYDRAIQAFRKATAIDPDRFEPHHLQFECYRTLGAQQEALHWARSAASLTWARSHERGEEAYQSFAHLVAGDMEKWRYHLTRAAEIAPNWTNHRRELLNLDLRQGRAREALERYRAWFPYLFEESVNLREVRRTEGWGEMNPNNQANAAFEIAEILVQLGDRPRANYLLDLAWEFLRQRPRMGWHWFYNSGYGIRDAVRFALTDQPAKALAALREAVDAGFADRMELESSALDSLRDEPAFKTIMTEVEANWAEQLANVRRLKATGEMTTVPLDEEPLATAADI